MTQLDETWDTYPPEHLGSITVLKNKPVKRGTLIKTKTGKLTWRVTDIYRWHKGVIWVALVHPNGKITTTIASHAIGDVLP